jgi:hypothetical protein
MKKNISSSIMVTITYRIVQYIKYTWYSWYSAHWDVKYVQRNIQYVWKADPHIRGRTRRFNVAYKLRCYYRNCLSNTEWIMSGDSSVRRATRITAGIMVRCLEGVEISLLPTKQTVIHPSIQWVPGTFSRRTLRSRLEADYSSASSAKVKNTWS